jgi:hypothetical protein
MELWEDQWAFLSSVARMSPTAVSKLSTALRPVIRVRLAAMLSIERAGLPPPVVAALEHLGSISNPDFYETQRLRFSALSAPA